MALSGLSTLSGSEAVLVAVPGGMDERAHGWLKRIALPAIGDHPATSRLAPAERVIGTSPMCLWSMRVARSSPKQPLNWVATSSASVALATLNE
jgi:hypothetical protein